MGNFGSSSKALVKWSPAVLAILFVGSTLRADESAREYEIKAALLFNFSKFVEWPSSALNDAGSFALCIYGADPFGSALEANARDRTVHGKPIAIRRVGSISEARRCHAMFISKAESSNVENVLKALRGTSVLTVGEIPSFARSGGIINFTLEHDKVHLEINVDASERAGLRVSSRLLKIATVISNKPTSGDDG